jgi:hypothetical protein
MTAGSNLPGFAFTRLILADPDKVAVKTLTQPPGGGPITATDYDLGFLWKMRPFDVGDDFDKMAKALLQMAARERTILVMGVPRLGLDLRAAQRRLWARHNLLENTLLTTARAVLVIDVDDTTVPNGLGDPDHFIEGAVWVRDNKLPPEFHGVSMAVSPSARTGLRGPTLMRCRMSFLLDQPHALPDLKRWTRGLKLVAGVGDSAICTPGQPIYVGRPRFVGMTDPIPPDRWAVVARGSFDRVALVVDRYDPAIVVLDTKLRAATIAAGDDWRRFLLDTVGGAMSFFEPLSRGLGIAAQSNEPTDVIVAFALALIRDRAGPGRIAQYDAAWIRRSVERFCAADQRVRSRRDAALAQLFGDMQ